MRSPADAIEAYLRAKDENRPFLMTEAFAEDASLSIVVHSDNIAFPPVTQGRGAITDVLVRDFARTYENVRTVCLSFAPAATTTTFACSWLVAMSAKAD